MSSQPTAEARSGRVPERPRYAVGLLEQITASSLDEDYAHVAARRSSDAPKGARPVLLVVALLVLGMLLTTAAVQTSRGASGQQRSRDSLVAQVQDKRAELEAARERQRVLVRGVNRTARARDAAAGAATQVELRADRLAAATGGGAVTGPGLEITVDDKPDARTQRQVVLDEDLQRLVNGLWVAGAEAVSINGERLTPLSAIRGAGEAITVNFRSLRRPYVVRAIGDPDDLPARFIESAGGTWWLNLRSVYDLRFEMSSEDSLTLPAVPSLVLRHARVGDRVPGDGAGTASRAAP